MSVKNSNDTNMSQMEAQKTSRNFEKSGINQRSNFVQKDIIFRRTYVAISHLSQKISIFREGMADVEIDIQI